MKFVIWSAAGVVAALCVGPARAQEPLALELVCSGTGVVTIMETDNNRTIGDVTDDKIVARPVNAEGRVRLRINGSTGEIKMPATMPGGERDRWLRLEELNVGEERIAARIGTSPIPMFRPKVTIDRRSGELSIRSEKLNFSGACERAPDEPAARKF